MKKLCPLCGKEIYYNDIVKKYCCSNNDCCFTGDIPKNDMWIEPILNKNFRAKINEIIKVLNKLTNPNARD